jgi:hypothetical protein
MISSASEIVAYFLSGIFITYLGIKTSCVISFAIAMAGTICYTIFADDYVSAIPFMILGAKFGVAAAFNIIYLANALLFPPIIASTAFGICNIFGRLASISAP